MNYKSKMLSLKRSVVSTLLAGLSLALLAGCKTTTPPTLTPTPIMTPPAVETNKPALPPKLVAPLDSTDSMEPNILVWDAVAKEYQAHPGDKIASFSFSFTNVSPRQVVIYDTQTSCDCTVAKLPVQPWTIPSGGTGEIGATIDLAKKVGTVTNYVIVFTSQGNRRLNVKAIMPETK